MKEIGIVTFHNAHNYGACLQAYALQTYLKETGASVYIIDYDSNIKSHYNLILPPLRKNIIKYITQLAYNIFHYSERKKRYVVFQRFIDENLKLSEKHHYTANQLKYHSPKYDVYICGSDQIWNTELVGKLDDIFTLNFGSKDIIRISYAASIGMDYIKNPDEFKKKLHRFNRISVRENEAKELLTPLLNKRIEVVVDPVFLLDKHQWNQLIEDVPVCKEKYILVYSVIENENMIKIVNQIAQKTGYGVISFEKYPYKNIRKYMNNASPREFISLIKNAEIVIANSFHALAFSMIFHKNFWIVPHQTTNARIDQLLGIANLENRQIRKLSELSMINPLENINYGEYEKNMKVQIIKSKNFLQKSLMEKKNEAK